jgi:hypothetical protein
LFFPVGFLDFQWFFEFFWGSPRVFPHFPTDPQPVPTDPRPAPAAPSPKPGPKHPAPRPARRRPGKNQADRHGRSAGIIISFMV